MADLGEQALPSVTICQTPRDMLSITGRGDRAMEQQTTAAAPRAITRMDVMDVPTPERTETWVPLPHYQLLEEAERALERSGLHVVSERHALTRGGNHYFAVLQVTNGIAEGDYHSVVGLRNSHDKSFVAGLACGSRVIVCSNLAFGGEIVIARKHTAFIERDLPRLLAHALDQLHEQRRFQEHRIGVYKASFLGESETNNLLIHAIDEKVIAPSRIPQVLECWRGRGKNVWSDEIDAAFRFQSAWRLFNAFTFVLQQVSIFSLPRRTQALHELMDDAVGLRPPRALSWDV